MTPLENYLIDTVGFLEEIGLKPFLHSSTLLQIIRDGEFKLRHNFDKEINVGCLYEDLTSEVIEKIKAKNDHVKVVGDDVRDIALIFFGSGWKPGFTTAWQMDCFTLLMPFFKLGSKRVLYMGQNNLLVWPSYHLDKMETVNYKGHMLRVPGDTKEWLRHYFGGDWQKENLAWHWTTAGNHLNWKGGDISE